MSAKDSELNKSMKNRATIVYSAELPDSEVMRLDFDGESLAHNALGLHVPR